MSGYATEASKAMPGFASSAKRGQGFFARECGVFRKMPNYTVCHGKNPEAYVKHIIADKRINPLR